MTEDHVSFIRKAYRDACGLVKAGKLSAAEASLRGIVEREADILDGPQILQRSVALRTHIDKIRRLHTNRLLMLGIVVLNGLGVALLLRTEVATVSVDFGVVADHVSFRNLGPLKIEEVEAATLDITGFETIQVDATTGESEERESRLIFRTTTSSGFVSIDGPLVVETLAMDPSDVEITVDAFEGIVRFRKKRTTAEGGRWHGEIQPAENFVLEFSEVESKALAEGEETLRVRRTGPVFLDSGTGACQLEWTVPESPRPVSITSAARVTRLHVWREEADGQFSSTLRHAEIRFPGLRTSVMELRPGDLLTVDSEEGIWLVDLKVADEIVLRCVGEVTGLTVNGRSVMPNYLEWLHEHHGLGLYLTAFGSALAFLWAALARFELLRIGRD